MATATLNDFIGNYVRNQKIESGTTGFAKWLATQGVDPAADYEKRIRQAETAYSRALPHYGASGEKLARAGLSDSGYAAYLGGVAYSEKQKAKSNAFDRYTDDMKSAAADYASYLDKQQKEQNELFRKVENRIGYDGVLDHDTAVEYGIASGLDEETAAIAAKEGIALAVQKLRKTVLKAVLSGRMTKENAMVYARSFGLPESEVVDIGNAAEQYGKRKSYYSID